MTNSRRNGHYGHSQLERDSHGRFTSRHDNDQHYSNRGSYSRYEDEDDDYDNDYDYQNSYDDDDDYDYDQRDYNYDRRDYQSDYNDNRNGSHGRQGFASMPHEEVRRIAAMGGRASHGGGRSYSSSRTDYDYNNDYSNGRRSRSNNTGHGRQGFASMSRDEVRRIAAMGGRASHGGGRRSSRSYSRNQY